MESVQGLALVASPYLTDPNFLRSVIYMLRHDEEGAIGLILNRPTHTTVGELLEQLSGDAVENDFPVYYGGPVDGPLMLLQECTQEDEPSIFIASDQERILEICRPSPYSSSTKTDHCQSQYRVFDGYSGWAPDQLDEELRGGGWLVWNIQPQQLYADPEELWHNAVKQIGRDILARGIAPSKMPPDPAYN